VPDTGCTRQVVDNVEFTATAQPTAVRSAPASAPAETVAEASARAAVARRVNSRFLLGAPPPNSLSNLSAGPSAFAPAIPQSVRNAAAVAIASMKEERNTLGARVVAAEVLTLEGKLTTEDCKQLAHAFGAQHPNASSLTAISAVLHRRVQPSVYPMCKDAMRDFEVAPRTYKRWKKTIDNLTMFDCE